MYKFKIEKRFVHALMIKKESVVLLWGKQSKDFH
jgi:hypothetical protein